LELNVFNPAVSSDTNFTVLHSGEKTLFYTGGGLTAQGLNQQVTTFDGVGFFPSTSNITGNLTVYGLVN
jgi:hypothetical protein